MSDVSKDDWGDFTPMMTALAVKFLQVTHCPLSRKVKSNTRSDNLCLFQSADKWNWQTGELRPTLTFHPKSRYFSELPQYLHSQLRLHLHLSPGMYLTLVGTRAYSYYARTRAHAHA